MEIDEPAVMDRGDAPSVSPSTSGEVRREEAAIYAARASVMRSQIEEKITEIESKINASPLDLSLDSIDSIASPTDYNLITVNDVKRSRSCSVTEMRQSAIDRLQSKLEKAEKHLELKEGEVLRLRKIRDEVGSEIEDLTASLFEEANKMVRNAQVKEHKAEKRAKEANMKLGMLQDEVQALKNIVQSSEFVQCEKMMNQNIQETKDAYEVDPIFHEEFVAWRQNPTLDKDVPFMKRIYEEDIKSCLDFTNTELARLVLEAIEKNLISIEKLHDPRSAPKICALLNAPRLCPYQLCIDKEKYYICSLTRNRVAAVCDLFCYFRYLQQGFITLRIHHVYLEVLQRRRRITSAKLGLTDDLV